ncbi:class I SAM-dependent methyltransferase [Magnetofaba australis]|uniref:Putative type 11 methyltransferase n=1 Tax=Magnetofaba australis IT-1 TaxID=1434232 RepID=A0A1Y2K0W0_9PROT|nr:methyltransferase domain-containing protein [Magnetofaba australis]OSM01671.1 putative type 11 methyltransferase [Magnetofaba australis IT-1]
MSHDHGHHPKHRFDPARAATLLDPKRRLIDDPLTLVRQMGVGEGMRVADLGCGAGFFTLPLLEAVGDGGHVTAVDVQPEVLEFFRQRAPDAPNLALTEADLTATGLPDDAFDAVFIAFTLHETPAMAALAEAKRILKPGGVAIVMEWGEFGPCPEREPGRKAGPPEDHRLLAAAMREHLRANALEEVEYGERLGGCHYWIRARA